MTKGVLKDTPAGRVLRCRYEIKYLISESKAAAIAQFIRPYVRSDHYCKLQPNGSYPVASLYLDSESLQLCRQSMEGQKNRFKLRIRSYTDELDYPHFFEIKRRLNAIIIKSRARVMPADVAPLISGMLGLPQGNGTERQTLGQFLLYAAGINARPVVRTRYQRQAFEDILDDTVRVTFDRNISYSVTSNLDVGLNGEGWHRLPLTLNSIVLEIKFTDRYPAWLGRMVKYFVLRQQSVSKYVHSIKRASLVGLLLA